MNCILVENSKFGSTVISMLRIITLMWLMEYKRLKKIFSCVVGGFLPNSTSKGQLINMNLKIIGGSTK